MSKSDRASWQPLPEDEWQPTIRSLHRWSQVVGKVRLVLAPYQPHWWHVPLYVSARGLTTSAIPYDGGLVELELLLNEHRFEVRTSGGCARGPATATDVRRCLLR